MHYEKLASVRTRPANEKGPDAKCPGLFIVRGNGHSPGRSWFDRGAYL